MSDKLKKGWHLRVSPEVRNLEVLNIQTMDFTKVQISGVYNLSPITVQSQVITNNASPILFWIERKRHSALKYSY